MRRQIDLAGAWQVAHTEGMHGEVEHVRAWDVDEGRYRPITVPAEIHHALQLAGTLPDLNVGLHTLAARWVEQQWWQYRRHFDLEPADCASPAWLVCEGLDYQAIVYLNGEEIGRHANAHRPCRLEVTGKLCPGRNLLAVAVESGLYYVAERPGEPYAPNLDSRLSKRHWLRKPQYESGWDWNPHLLNVGITGAVRLEMADQPWLDTVVVLSALSDDHSRAAVEVRAFVHNPAGAGEYDLRVRIRETGAETRVPTVLPPGDSRVVAVIEITGPALWWPRGHGEQTLYTVEVALERAGAVVDMQTRRTGIRQVRIVQEPHPVAGRYCIVAINGRPIFCKGGNWAPADMIPSRVTRERLSNLIDLAVQANFNFLRINGVGLYAGHTLLELCDEAGLLVWHDLPFGCARYPSDDPAFLAEVRTEITWAVRAFAAHPSLMLWCGNNEQEWAAFDWGYDRAGKALPDYALYHHVIPVILKQEDNTRPYWPSSPYSPDHEDPNSPLLGDQHPWGVGFPDGTAATPGGHSTNFWAYRTFVDRLPNEGGFLGASTLATLRAFLPDGERHLRSPSWDHHDNAVNFWRQDVQVTYLAVNQWLGRDPYEMSMDDYGVASGLVQAEALAEYVHNYRRRMFSSAAACFWSYNDSWPVTHGWTIVDYYLRQKLSYHPVRRAFAPVTVVVAEEGGQLLVYGINDTPAEWMGEARFGVFTLGGAYAQDERQTVTLPANASTPLGAIDRKIWETTGAARAGAFACLARDGAPVAQHRLFHARFGELSFGDPSIRIERRGDQALFTANAFAWAVCLDIEGDGAVADNAFDLFPGITYAVPWPRHAADPRIVCIGSRDLVAARQAQQ